MTTVISGCSCWTGFKHLTGEEAEAISGRLVERLTDLLIFEVLVDNTDGDKVLARQVRLWQMLHMAHEEGQMQLGALFPGAGRGRQCAVSFALLHPHGRACQGVLQLRRHSQGAGLSEGCVGV